ncbi:MAG TPA: asparagine synthase C-terminal domain-containing protein, partial [Roseivirga sp.]
FFLSGGIDSGLNVALASEISTKKIKTFSVGFSDDHSDELAQAKLLSTKFGTDHHEIRINPDIQKIAKEITAYVGEPFADYSLIPNALICEALRSKATVAISGDGGDELFGGYRHFLSLYQARYMLKKYGRQLAQLKVIGSKPLSRILPSIVDNLGSIQGHLKIKSDDEILIRSIRNINSMNIYHRQFFVDSSFKYDYLSQFRKTNNDDIHTVQQMLSLRTLLLNDYLVKVDRASMYNSLEVRSPFLDHHLAEFAFTIPNELKFKGMNSKYLLRKLATNKFGRNVMKEPKKGFVIPMQHWLRKQLKPWVTSMLLDSFANRQIIDPSIISVVLNEHMDKGIDHGDFIWKMVALEIWFQECN